MRQMCWLLVLAVALVGFGSSSAPAAPPSVDVTGTWTGTWICTGFGAGEAWATLQQSGAKVTGALWLRGELDNNPGGLVHGTIDGNVVTLNWATRDASGLTQFVVRGEAMSGSAQLQERLQFNLARAL
jgi:hypothetical protein